MKGHQLLELQRMMIVKILLKILNVRRLSRQSLKLVNSAYDVDDDPFHDFIDKEVNDHNDNKELQGPENDDAL